MREVADLAGKKNEKLTLEHGNIFSEKENSSLMFLSRVVHLCIENFQMT